MMTRGEGGQTQQTGRDRLLEAGAGYTLFAGLGFLARFLPVGFHLMGAVGFLLPLAWGYRTGRWREMGFTRDNWRAALLWGLGAGLLASLIGLITLPARSLAPRLGQQLALGIPFGLLLASPFQEFFFRGWLQTRLEGALGGWGGLLLSNVCFLLWHYLVPFAAMPGWSYPLYTVGGFLGTLAAGLVFGYSFQRTRSILAPWLAHGLSQIAFAAVGAVVFSDLAGWLAAG